MRLYGTYDTYRASMEGILGARIFCGGEEVTSCVGFNQCEGWAVGCDCGDDGLLYVAHSGEHLAMYGVTGNITIMAKS